MNAHTHRDPPLTRIAGVALLSTTLLLTGGCPTHTYWIVLPGEDSAVDSSVDDDAALSCSGTLVSCEGECVDLSGTPSHCGECDQQCESEEQCVGGSCVCRPDLTLCGEDCVDTDMDPGHCGGCNNNCTATATPYCHAGDCTATVCEDQVPTTVTCGSEELSCVSLQQMETSPLHCGECESTCEADELCATGECQSYYPAAGCTACPCNDVCGSNLCCTLPGAAVLICLVGATSCP